MILRESVSHRQGIPWNSPYWQGNAAWLTNCFLIPGHLQNLAREPVNDIHGRAQYFAGGDLVDSRYEPWDSQIRIVHGYVLAEQPQLLQQPWVKDIVNGECHQNLRDHSGYGRWGRCVSGYSPDEDDQLAMRGGHRGMQIHYERVSSNESGSLSWWLKGSSQRSRGSSVTQWTHSDSSKWHARSWSSSASRSPSADRCGKHRHQSPPWPKPPMFSGKEGEWTHSYFSSTK